MANFPSPFGGGDEDLFDDYDEFVPAHLPDPGPFLDDHLVLVGDDHVAFHEITRELFEERGVYDATFGYNLARLNLDARHPNAGYRYAVERDTSLEAGNRDTSPEDGNAGVPPEDDESMETEWPAVASKYTDVLRAEFTPTTPFCPQAHALATGSFRAWNADLDRHGYDLVRVRVAPMHHQSDQVNAKLAELEETFQETGDVAATVSPGGGSDPVEPNAESRGSARSPF